MSEASASKSASPASSMPEEEPVPELLRPFYSLPPSGFLSMAPLSTLSAGVKLFQDGWGAAFTVPRPGRLEAVDGPHEASIWSDGGRLLSSCTCAEASQQNHCRHACCLFAGVMALLHGKIPGGAIPNQHVLLRYRKAFHPAPPETRQCPEWSLSKDGSLRRLVTSRVAWMSPPDSPGGAMAEEVVPVGAVVNRLELHFDNGYSIRKRGIIPKLVWDSLGPLAWLRSQGRLPLEPTSLIETITRLLHACQACRIPLVFCRGDRVSSPLFTKQRIGRWCLMLNREVSGAVRVGIVLKIGEEGPLPIIDDLNGAGAILHSGEVVEAEPGKAEALAHRLSGRVAGDGIKGPLAQCARWEAVLAAEDFNAESAALGALGEPETFGEIELFLDGAPSRVTDPREVLDEGSEPEARLLVRLLDDPDTKEGSVVEMAALCDSMTVSLDRVCREIVDHFYRGGMNVHLFRRTDRLAWIFNLATELHSIPELRDASELISGRLMDEPLIPQGIKREVRALLESYHRNYVGRACAKDLRLLVDRFAGWKIFRLPFEKIARCVVALPENARRWASPLRLMGSYKTMSVQKLASRLLPLIESLGASMEYNGRPVSERRLSISVNVTRKSSGKDKEGGFDWFDLHPDVVCDEFTIPQEEWERLLRGEMLDLPQKGWVVPDEESLDALGRVASLYTKRTGRWRRADDSSQEQARGASTLEILEWIDLQKNGVKIDMPADILSLIESLTNFQALPEAQLPQGFRARLRPYQKRGFDWLAFLYTHRLGACLADDMGLGKTLQACAFLHAIEEGTLPAVRESYLQHPHLVVVPPSLVFNWQSELRKFCPALKVAGYSGGRRNLPAARRANVVLTTYDILRLEIDRISEEPFHVVVFDEAQLLKNRDSGRAKAASRLKRAFTLCLTGTPVENHAGEYHAILDLALPGLLGDYREFVCAAKRDPASAVARTRPVVLRRTKEAILNELPPKVEQDIQLEMTSRQREMYIRMVAEVSEEVRQAYALKPAQQAGIVALTCLMRLRQICISPALLDSRAKDEPSPKLIYLTEKLTELAEQGHSALIFSQFVGALDLACAEAQRAGFHFLRLDGSTPASKRRDLVEKFQNSSEPLFFFISLRSGGVGLNLTKAAYVFHLDPWWNPSVENQASDRAHRIGQKNRVLVQRLIMRSSVESTMMALKEKKRALFEQIVGGAEGRAASATLTADDIAALLLA